MTSKGSPAAIAAPSGYEALLAIDPSVLEAIPAAVYICAADGLIVRFNPGAAELWGRAPEIGDTDERFCGSFRLYRLDGTLLPHARTPMATALRTGEPQRDKEVVIERRDGSRMVASVQIDILKDHYGRVQGAINCFQDVTERKRTEQSLARRMEEQAALFRITDSLHRAQSLADVYDSALDAILRALPCQRASILLFDEAGVMRFVAWRGLSEAYRRAVDGHSPWTPDAKDPKPICVDDVESADLPEPLRATIKAEGIGALAFIPLVTSGKLVGKFMSYYDTSHIFTDAELDLAVAIGRQLGFGVERIRAEQARRIAAADLRESEARERARAAELRTIMEAVPAVIWIARDPECRVISGKHGFL
jgi:PAS domain S-box-containing protein